jgi:hypothetical protein
MIWGSISRQGKEFVSFQIRPDKLWPPPSSYLAGTRDLPLAVKRMRHKNDLAYEEVELYLSSLRMPSLCG